MRELPPGFAHVELDAEHFIGRPRLLRPAEVDLLLGDPAKARRSSAGAEISFERLVEEMVEVDLERVERQARL